MIERMARNSDENTDHRSRLRRILDWDLPGTYAWYRWTRSPRIWFYPEAELFDSPKQYRTARRRSLKSEVLWSPLHCVLAASLVAIYVVLMWGTLADALRPYNLPTFLLIETGWMVLFYLIFRDKIRRDLRRQLFDLGRPICIPCGYDLTGNDSGRCPECGWRIGRGVGWKADSAPPGPIGGDMTELGAGVDRHGR